MHFQGLLLVRAPQTNFDGIKILNKINKVENRTSNMAGKKAGGGGEVGEGALLTSQHSSFSFTCAFSAANPQSKAHALVQSKAQSQTQSQSQCAASSTSTATSAEMLKLILRLCCNKLIEFALSQASCIGIGRGGRNGKRKGHRERAGVGGSS